MRPLLLLSLAATLCSPPTEAAPRDSRPNVLLIVSDDQAWTDFGFMGSAAVRTPRLDRLAAEGLCFERGYVPTALCRPSLATLATGLYPHQHGITGNDPPKGVDRAEMLVHIDRLVTLPELLGAAGYRSLQTGKWWEGAAERGGFTEGMTHGDPTRRGRHGDVGLTIGRQTLEPIFEFVEGCQERGEPFFVWYAPFLPHRPHDPPARLLEGQANEERPASVSRYYAMCAWLDETCGALLDHLAARDLAEDTLVVFVVDNGWIQQTEGAGFAPRSKRSPYEGGVRTPILLRWPGTIEPGRVVVPVSSVDLAPTILAACGIEAPRELPGRDLRAIDLQASPPRPVFGASFTHDVVDLEDPARSVLARWMVADPWKLIEFTDPERAPELYDLRADPAERRDLAAEQAARVGRMRASLDGWWSAGH